MLTIDADSQRAIFGPGASADISVLKLKRRLVAALPVQFSRSTQVVEMPNDFAAKIEFKLQGEYDCQPITGAQNCQKFGSGTSTYYVFLFALINPALDRLFGFDDPQTFTVTTGSDLINAVAHGKSVGDKLQFNSSTDDLPLGLDFGKDYFIIASGFTVDAYRVSEISGGTQVDIQDAGSGTLSFVRVSNDVDLVLLNCDIYWIHTSGTVEGKTQTLEAQIENDVTRAGDIIPDSPAIVYSHDSFWRAGTAAPSDSLGLDGDFYIDTLWGSGYFDIYARDGGTYDLIGNIAGKSAGFRYIFNAATSSDPGSGACLFNHATFASATAFHVSKTDKTGVGISAFLATQDDSTSSSRCFVIGRKVGGTAFFSFAITGALSNFTLYDTFPITPILLSGIISTGDPIELMFVRTGDAGAQGSQGSAGAQGNQGFQGLRGFQGFQGFQGSQGSQGSQGTQGFQGFQGDGASSNAILPESDPLTTETRTHVSNGDTNGAFYRIGTNFGRQAWSNPHTAGRVKVVRSSSANGTDTEIVDRMPVQYNTTGNSAGEWMGVYIALDEARELTVSGYVMANGADGSGTHAPYNWKLQGSTNVASPYGISEFAAATWDDLDSRVNNTTIAQVQGAYGFFSVTPTTPYTAFRILATGVNQGGDATVFLQMSELELYGTLTHGIDYDDGNLMLFKTNILARPGIDDATTPSNAVTPVGYVKINVAGTDSWLEYFQ